jgi:hypothetical protein
MKTINYINKKINFPEKIEWEINFIKSEKFKLFKNRLFELSLERLGIINNPTPRERKIYSGDISSCLHICYVIEYLMSINSSEIVDIGCGMNMFKELYPIIGVDPTDPRADINAIFDRKFVKIYREKFNSAIAINSLHFIPIWQIKKRLKQFSNIIKKNGLGYLTINSHMLIRHTDNKFLSDNKLYENCNLSKYLFEQIFELDNILEILYYEDNINNCLEPGLNGDIKILFMKKLRTPI